ncbi:RHS repeat-associated core domain-containing protein [Wolbachia endosymbiont (group B) of Sphaerophoria taeniata]|uniref:RHS repeat-associated core domain-containing protein n=1 Tax=Wolbachia endosymbiont (group B) of Sphaerophoria taeniata TaxID=2954058 RepID=UPI00221FED28|nr:RHS repeat-associated core domain-containing protein [Wolbachia endosymbiont (group B) of Sphaerophoria taeniata]
MRGLRTVLRETGGEAPPVYSPTELKDRFLTERVYYTNGSYGGYGYGDGTITRTEFKANWHESCDDSKLGLNEKSFVSEYVTSEESAFCFRELKKKGYLNDNGHQTKVSFTLRNELPIICRYGSTGRHIQNTLGREGFPREYGHSYDYGNYQELTKAKYFVGKEAPMPLQPDSFAREIPRMNETASRDIWERLKESWYLIEDNEKVDLSLGHGKRGKSFIKGTLLDDLKSVNADYGWYELPLEEILIEYFAQKRDLSSLKVSLRDAFVRWGSIEEANANKIVKMLEEKGYLKNPFAKEFNEVLERYQPYVHEIVSVLSEHFAKRLGEAEFDVESYSIDANGNHGHFYTGFDRYEIGYRNNTNQVSNVKFQSFASSERKQNFLMKHDSRGNVIQALHKGIEQIDYHPVSNRATKIKLTDGRTLEFYYDARGERVLKRVYDKAGETTKEIHYIRDEFGRALVEREVTYIAGGLRPDVSVTAYIYGPRGLFGFIRNNEFYNVITDHEGSIRLVVKGDEVVAAYDYLPYGNLMRKYESDPEGQISYRYTGQEWDEEIGLYNYHSRFYDPSIGRFYQIDPKEQYFSPYKYAGNSPVSMVDPDGELAFLALLPFIIAGATAGGYLGGAAANNRWDFTVWDFKSKETWLGITGGGIAGAFVPVGFAGSVGVFTSGFATVGLSTTSLTTIGGFSVSASSLAAIGATTALGTGGAYLSMSSANNEWNPGKWDYRSPATWNAGFHGFALGSSIPAGIHGARIAYGKLSSSLSRGAFISGGGAFSVGSFVKSGFDNQWDFSKPGIYYGGLQALDDATNLPVFARSFFKSARRGFKDIAKGMGRNRGYSLLEGTHNHRYVPYAAGKMALKVLGVSVPSLMLTELNEGLDMSNPSTYFSIVRQMAMVNQNWLIGKSFYRKSGFKKRLEINEQKKLLSKRIADDAIDSYMSKLRSTPGSSSADNAMIPNRAVAVGMTDRYAVAGFSGNKGKGFIAFYRHNKFKAYEPLDELYLENNKYIANREVSASDDPVRNLEIITAINKVQEDIKRDNARLLNNISAEDLSKMLPGLGVDLRERVVQELKATLGKDVMIDKGDLSRKMVEHLEKVNTNYVEYLHKKIKQYQDRMKELGRDIKQSTGQENKIKELEGLQKEVRTLKGYLREQKIDDLKKQVNLYLNKGNELVELINSLDDRLTHWDYNNCAEPHVITALSRGREIFANQALNIYQAFREDIKFLATYKINRETGELEDFPRCGKCTISTQTIHNVMTDPDWSAYLSYNIDNYNEKLGRYGKNVPHFLLTITNSSLKAENSSSIRGKRSVFVGHGEVETIPNPRTRSSKLTSISNQLSKESIIDINKKITNSATRTSSWINDLFGWIRSSVSGLLGSELPEVVSSTKSPISQVDAKMDVNGTIMLLDVLIRKVTGQKYISTADQSISQLEAQGYALNITEVFKKVIEQAGLKSGVSMHRLNIDFVEIQKEVTGKIMSGKFDEISGVLSSYLEKACPSREAGCPGKLSSKKFDKFMVEFNSRLNVVLNRSIQRILHNGDGRLEVDGAKQMNLEPQSYLSNASVQGHSKDKVSTCLSEIGVTKLGGNLNR